MIFEFTFRFVLGLVVFGLDSPRYFSPHLEDWASVFLQLCCINATSPQHQDPQEAIEIHSDVTVMLYLLCLSIVGSGVCKQ